MKKRTKSSTESVMVSPTRRLSPAKPSISPETLTFMKQCEAREWIRRYSKKIQEIGKLEAANWWDKTKSDIAKRRGEKAMLELVKQMQEERRAGRA